MGCIEIVECGAFMTGYFHNTNKGKMMKCKGIEHGIISAGIDSEIMLNGCLSIIDMAVHALADVEDCNDVRGSLYHCRIMLQLLMPDDDNTVYEDEELEAARQEARARETETRPKAYGVDACKCKGVRG